MNAILEGSRVDGYDVVAEVSVSGQVYRYVITIRAERYREQALVEVFDELD